MALALVGLVWHLRGLALDLIVSGVLAVICEPAVRGLHRLGMRRSMAVPLVFVLILGLLVLIGFLVSVPIYQAGSKLLAAVPHLIQQEQSSKGRLSDIIRQLGLESYLKNSATKVSTILANAAHPAFTAARQVLSTVVGLVTILVVAIFISLEAPTVIKAGLSRLSEDTAGRIRTIITETSTAVTGYVMGNLATSMVAGLVVGITLTALGVPYPVVLAIWVGAVDLLPLVGGLLAGVPTVGLAFLHSTGAGLVTLIVFTVYQQIENHVLNPVIMSRTVQLNPLWILLAVLIGAQLAGITGALVGIPVASAMQVVSRDLWQWRNLSTSEIDENESEPGISGVESG